MAHRLGEAFPDNVMKHGYSEFREMNIYWLWVLYLGELALARESLAEHPAKEEHHARHQDEPEDQADGE